MNTKRLSMIKTVLCMVAVAMLMSSHAFAIPVFDGRFDQEGYTAGKYLNFEVENYVDGNPLGPQGEGGIYGDDPGEEQGQLWYYQEGSGGDLYLAFIQPKSLIDNSYGANAIGWVSGHKLDELHGSDAAHITLTDNGSTVFDITFDYLYSNSKDAPTDWGSGFASSPSDPVEKYDTKVDGDKVYESDYPGIEVITSMQYNWDQGFDEYFGHKDTNPYSPYVESDYSTNSAEPGWIYENIYEIKVDGSLLAESFAFDNITIGEVHDSPNKIGGKKVWAILDGDIQSVPEPATMLLLGFGLIGLAVLRRKFSKS